MHLRSIILAGLGLLVSTTLGAHLPLLSRALDKPRCLVQEDLPQRRSGRRLLDYVPTAEPIIIKTYVHIIARDKTVSGGWVTQEALDAQMRLLNTTYAGTGFQFNWIREETTRTVNVSWTQFPSDWNSYFPEVSRWELNWKRQLRKGGDDIRVLNLYFNVGLPAAGVAVLIDQQGELDSFRVFDGAIIDPSTMPGGPDPLINEGKTVTHEVGHWVGLYHTFQGGCADQDLVQDTPPARAPPGGFSFCDRVYNTCSDTLGPNGTDAPDPNDNYMSYSTDPCMTKFTPGQIARMHQIWETYRAKK
ncbi:hypothetical protein PpBr36_04281 [Pyricularia pennisetigena]|uniref:hypothetical protein n=1 Tax=Pyricularia pennisetigena TaxID=1578925 RepID=UPI0011516D14|nr:hypothetical protein PpBr36_04281 [Pyricularia pennisetigena]TLS26750.1 hypothetical protein PpBr36_04281 [Pyricularia pennisetigena]